LRAAAADRSRSLSWSGSPHLLGWIASDDLSTSKRIRDVIKPPTVTANPNTPLNEALSMMLNSAIGTLSVLDDQQCLLGILTFEMIREVLGQQEDQ